MERYANPRKTTSIRILGEVDISDVREQILAIPESVWNSENEEKPNKFEALAQTRHIVFRFIDSPFDWRAFHDRKLWSEWKDRLIPLMDMATRAYGYHRGAYPRVMLARMPPGEKILPHQDANPAAKWPHKIHIPILTNDKVIFYVEGIGYRFSEGQAVEVNNMGVHAVENFGDTDRIHLIFEYFDLDQSPPHWIGG